MNLINVLLESLGTMLHLIANITFQRPKMQFKLAFLVQTAMQSVQITITWKSKSKKDEKIMKLKFQIIV